MKARFVYESLDFERGGDPYQSLGIGMDLKKYYLDEEIKKLKKKYKIKKIYSSKKEERDYLDYVIILEGIPEKSYLKVRIYYRYWGKKTPWDDYSKNSEYYNFHAYLEWPATKTDKFKDVIYKNKNINKFINKLEEVLDSYKTTKKQLFSDFE